MQKQQNRTGILLFEQSCLVIIAVLGKGQIPLVFGNRRRVFRKSQWQPSSLNAMTTTNQCSVGLCDAVGGFPEAFKNTAQTRGKDTPRNDSRQA